MAQVLITDKSGTPREWVSMRDACKYYVTDKVLYSIGSEIKEFIGGKNNIGETSKIKISSIISVSGRIDNSSFDTKESSIPARSILYARDRYVCAYCGDIMSPKEITADHINPKSRGGKNTWMNMVAACKPCNNRKGNRTPEEARMSLLFIPYVPNKHEKILLTGKKILADQMEFLMARIPKTSRVWENKDFFLN